MKKQISIILSTLLIANSSFGGIRIPANESNTESWKNKVHANFHSFSEKMKSIPNITNISDAQSIIQSDINLINDLSKKLVKATLQEIKNGNFNVKTLKEMILKEVDAQKNVFAKLTEDDLKALLEVAKDILNESLKKIRLSDVVSGITVVPAVLILFSPLITIFLIAISMIAVKKIQSDAGQFNSVIEQSKHLLGELPEVIHSLWLTSKDPRDKENQLNKYIADIQSLIDQLDLILNVNRQ